MAWRFCWPHGPGTELLSSVRGSSPVTAADAARGRDAPRVSGSWEAVGAYRGIFCQTRKEGEARLQTCFLQTKSIQDPA